MYKILIILMLAVSPLSAYYDESAVFLHAYAHAKKDEAWESRDLTYSDEIESYFLGKIDAYNDMIFLMDFVLFQKNTD